MRESHCSTCTGGKEAHWPSLPAFFAPDRIAPRPGDGLRSLLWAEHRLCLCSLPVRCKEHQHHMGRLHKLAHSRPPRHCPLALRHAHAKERENCATARKGPKNQPLGTLYDLMVSSETTSVVEHTLDLQGNWKQHLFPFGSASPFK